MVCNRKKEKLYLILLVFLMLAMIGSFAFSTNEVLNNSDTDKLGPAGFFSSADLNFDWLAENTTTIRKAIRYSSLPLRNGFFRVFASILICSTAMCLIRPHYLSIKNDNTIIFKNNILLKLRI